LPRPAQLRIVVAVAVVFAFREMTLDKKSFSIKVPMAEHIEDLWQRFAELNERIQLVRSFL
jgi:hypothetical protein